MLSTIRCVSGGRIEERMVLVLLLNVLREPDDAIPPPPGDGPAYARELSLTGAAQRKNLSVLSQRSSWRGLCT